MRRFYNAIIGTCSVLFLWGSVEAAGAEPELFLGRGFTGHEHLTWFGLINMNARLYDPLLGRFLSPDPYVQAPDFTQNFNRYSYALNNPLKYTDDDGEFVLSALLVSIGIGAAINVAFNWDSIDCLKKDLRLL